MLHVFSTNLFKFMAQKSKTTVNLRRRKYNNRRVINGQRTVVESVLGLGSAMLRARQPTPKTMG
jgi:hypothetical protein